MRIPDTRVLTSMVFCCLAALAIGCGESSKKTSDAAAADSARDTGPSDTAQDLAKPDSANDVVPPDLSPDFSADRAITDAPVDSNRGDGPETDASPLDGARGQDAEVGADSQTDAVLTTMANITFRFKNTGASTLYVHQGCTIFIKVTSMADGATYGTDYACACTCASATCNGTLACGACAPPSGVPIDAGSVKDIFWTAQLTISQTKTGPYGSFQCLVHSPIPTGPYKVEISVYGSNSDATSETNSRKVEKTFTLGTADATVEVPIQ
jgi:hypothetical protein